MYKIIAFSGSHGVGKTSLVNKICANINKTSQNQYKIFNEFNTGLYNMGFSLNGNGLDLDEVVFSQQQAFNLGYNTAKYYLNKHTDTRLIITDRSCIDTYLYTKYFVTKANQTSTYASLLQDMEAKSNQIANNIFTYLVPPFNDFDKTEVRMTIDERDDIWCLFKDYFAKQNLCNTLTSNTTTERYKEFLSNLNINPTALDKLKNLFTFA